MLYYAFRPISQLHGSHPKDGRTGRRDRLADGLRSAEIRASAENSAPAAVLVADYTLLFVLHDHKTYHCCIADLVFLCLSLFGDIYRTIH